MNLSKPLFILPLLKVFLIPSSLQRQEEAPAKPAKQERRSDVVEDPVDQLLSQQDGQIVRQRDPQLCRHGPQQKCLHCVPLGKEL